MSDKSPQKKTMTKFNVIAAVEPVDCTNPKSALEQAMKVPEKMITRLKIADYIPALEVLMAKGYTQEESSDLLVSIGCPFKSDSILVRYRELKRINKGKR